MAANLPKTKEEAVYERLKDEILRGVLKPGSMISEREIMESYGVSPSPVRHAFARIQESGWLKSMPRRGYVITQISLEDVQEILELRLALEPLAAATACDFITDEDVDALRELSDVSYEADNPSSYIEYLRANREFHVSIGRIARNRRLELSIGKLLDDLQRAHLWAIPVATQDVKHDEHAGLVEALARRDHLAAHSVAVETVEAASRRISGAVSALLERKPLFGQGRAIIAAE